MSKVRITQSYKDLNSLNLGKDFIREHKLSIGRRYPIVVTGMEDFELSGTIQSTHWIDRRVGGVLSAVSRSEA